MALKLAPRGLPCPRSTAMSPPWQPGGAIPVAREYDRWMVNAPERRMDFVGSAGEHFVLYQLHRRNLLAAQAPRGFKAVDILVLNPDRSVIASIQVKTRSSGDDGGWHMKKKHESLMLPGLFYCFVDLEPTQPNVYVVPCAIVAEVVTKSHAAWLAAPGRGGKPHNDNDMRRVLPAYKFAVDGYSDGWMEDYWDRWDLLKQST